MSVFWKIPAKTGDWIDVRDHVQPQAIDQLDRACTNMDDWMMLMQTCTLEGYFRHEKDTMIMMIAYITIKSGLVPLIEGLCAQTCYFGFEIIRVRGFAFTSFALLFKKEKYV